MLETKVQFLKGVGPKFGQKLTRLGIETISDLFFYYPRRYEDYTDIKPIKDLQNYDFGDDGRVTIRARIVGITNKKTSRRKFTITEAVVEDGTGSLKIVWFNQPFLAKMLMPGRELILNGKVSWNRFSNELVMESPTRAIRPMIVPVYGETEGLSSFFIAKLFARVSKMVSALEEYLPKEIISNYKLMGLREAILNLHQPEDSKRLTEAQRRIAFDELFLISLRANLSKEFYKKEKSLPFKFEQKEIDQFVGSLPFQLTGDQRDATEVILTDVVKTMPMNRLLNGDVGSGKTVVAAISALAAVRAGFRVAVMCPTAILANQHFETFCRLFERYEISVGLLTSDRQESTKSGISNVKSGSKSKDSKLKILNSNIVIGTQALIQKDVVLENLGLVIVDEQHRFGVAQRATLQELGVVNGDSANAKTRPHFLSMTATPIPRTMHLALFGDLDLTLIKEKPANRKEIKTKFVEPQNRNKAYEFIREHIKHGRQVFVICPLIEEKAAEVRDENKLLIADEASTPANLFEADRKSVKSEYEKLQKIFPEMRIGMLHGKMKSKEKDGVMAEFSGGNLDILVSTSVVEVGVDVPNATVMMIEDAERFGLAQIHQFRGRVGRGEYQSFCFLFSSTMSPKAMERLKSLEETADGFKLAEIDLETRGPGAMFGTEQSGLLDLKMASFSDQDLISEASMAAKSIVQDDPNLEKHRELKGRISQFMNHKHME